MTKEEAREVLKQIRKKKCVSECDYDCKLYESETFCLEEKALDMAIKALEQQPCEDCISREAVINGLKLGYFYMDLQEGKNDPCVIDAMMDWAIRAVKRQPSVTPQPTGWIPVSERLPEEDGFYLATCDGEICGEDKPIFSMAEFENGKWVDDEDDYQCVLAWMPLPQPYKAESEETE